MTYRTPNPPAHSCTRSSAISFSDYWTLGGVVVRKKKGQWGPLELISACRLGAGGKSLIFILVEEIDDQVRQLAASWKIPYVLL